MRRTREARSSFSADSRDKTGLSTRRVHGPILMRRLGVTQFKAAPDAWKSKQKTAETMMSEFEKEFGGEEPAKRLRPSANTSRRRRSERRPTPKEKKEKKAKKKRRRRRRRGPRRRRNRI